MAQAVNQFFLNGGTTGYIVALNNNVLSDLTPAMVTLSGGNLAQATSAAASGMTFTATEVTDELYAMAITIRPVQGSPAATRLPTLLLPTVRQSRRRSRPRHPHRLPARRQRRRLSRQGPAPSSRRTAECRSTNISLTARPRTRTIS